LVEGEVVGGREDRGKDSAFYRTLVEGEMVGGSEDQENFRRPARILVEGDVGGREDRGKDFEDVISKEFVMGDDRGSDRGRDRGKEEQEQREGALVQKWGLEGGREDRRKKLDAKDFLGLLEKSDPSISARE
jgi:hypothetical protein